MTEPRIERIGDAILYQGDCYTILPTLLPVDAVITDPPYGIDLGEGKETRKDRGLVKQAYATYSDTYDNFLSVVVPALTHSISIAKRAAVFCSGIRFADLPRPDAMGGVHIKAATARHCWGFNSFTPLALYGKGAEMHTRGCRSVVLESSATTEQNGHPCPKPIEWMDWLVDLASAKGDTVLDPFMGSGTTGVACANLGRSFVGIEIDPTYFQIACERISAAYAQGRLFA
jgi:site-specific DNA-methyltransferase (adenine-specific)